MRLNYKADGLCLMEFMKWTASDGKWGQVISSLGHTD